MPRSWDDFPARQTVLTREDLDDTWDEVAWLERVAEERATQNAIEWAKHDAWTYRIASAQDREEAKW